MHSRTKKKDPCCRDDVKEYSALLLPVPSTNDWVFENNGRHFTDKVGGDSDQMVADGTKKKVLPPALINSISDQMLKATRKGAFTNDGILLIFLLTFCQSCPHD